MWPRLLLRLKTHLDAVHVPLFLYPFLNTTSKTRPFEYLRLTSLGVIGALVKVTFQLRVAPRDLFRQRKICGYELAYFAFTKTEWHVAGG